MMNLVKANEPWLDVVPDDWKRSRIKNVSLLSPGYSDHPPRNGELCAVVPMEKVSDNGIVDTSDQIYFEDIQSGLTLFEKGDVLFAKITPCMENGKGAFVESLPTQYAFGSTEFHVLRPSHAVDGKFLYFYTLNSVFRAYAAENMSGAAGQKRVSSRFIKDTRLFLPPLPEQRCIAAYLDKTCAAIDAAIEKKQKQLETLDALRKSIIHKAVTRGLDDSVELKDSGVDYLGRIPKGWNVDRLKDVVNLRNIKTDENSEAEDYLELEDIDQSTGKILSKRNTLKVESAVTLFKKADVLFGKLRPYLEKYYLAEFDGKCTGEILAFEPEEITGRFLLYCIASSWFIGQCNMMAYGAKMPRVNWPTQLAKINMPLPPKEEQHRIADYIDAKCAEIGNLRKNITDQISTLENYRKSLIHECVTGKRRIAG